MPVVLHKAIVVQNRSMQCLWDWKQSRLGVVHLDGIVLDMSTITILGELERGLVLRVTMILRIVLIPYSVWVYHVLVVVCLAPFLVLLMDMVLAFICIMLGHQPLMMDLQLVGFGYVNRLLREI